MKFGVQEAILPETQPKVFPPSRTYVPAKHSSTLIMRPLTWNISDRVKDNDGSNTTLLGLKWTEFSMWNLFPAKPNLCYNERYYRTVQLHLLDSTEMQM